MLTVTLLVCAMMALTRANGGDDTPINGTATPVLQDALLFKDCPRGWTLYGGRCFKFFPTELTWAQAQAQCEKKGGNLASIRNADEYAFAGLLTAYLPTWIGGSDCQERGHWFWIDGEHMDYTQWCRFQPTNTLHQCCAQMNAGVGKCWADIPCSTLLPSVCVRDF